MTNKETYGDPQHSINEKFSEFEDKIRNVDGSRFYKVYDLLPCEYDDTDYEDLWDWIDYIYNRNSEVN